jgi:hypothetical protein
VACATTLSKPGPATSPLPTPSHDYNAVKIEHAVPGCYCIDGRRPAVGDVGTSAIEMKRPIFFGWRKVTVASVYYTVDHHREVCQSVTKKKNIALCTFTMQHWRIKFYFKALVR